MSEIQQQSEVTEIQQKSKKRAMLVLVGCCLMQMVALGTVLNLFSAVKKEKSGL